MGFENLTDVHTAGNAERVENDFHWRAVWQVGHVFFRKDPGDDAFVAVTAGHLAADGELALHGEVALDQLDDAGGQFVALLHLADFLVGDLAQYVDLARGHLLDLVDLLIHTRIFVVVANALEVTSGDALDGVAVKDRAFGEETLVGALVVQVSEDFLASENAFEALEALVGENADFVREVLFELSDLLGFDLTGALVLFLTLAGEDADVDHGALDARRAGEGSVANIVGLFSEGGAKKLFFRRELSFAFGRYLADQNVVVVDFGADADDAALIQIAQRVLADVGDVAGDFFRTELGVASFDLELLDVEGRVVVLAHEFFGDEDRVFEVVTAPWHEGHKHVTAEAELALFRAGTVGDDLTFQNAVALTDDRFLIDAGVLVGPLEFDELVDVGPDLTRELRGVVLAFDTDDDAL